MSWCDTYPENSWEEMSFKTGMISVPEEQPVILHNSKPVPDEELDEFWDSITDLIEEEDWKMVEAQLHERASYPTHNIRQIFETIEAQLCERDFECPVETIETKKSEYQTFKVLVPVRENKWEDYHSAIIPSRSVAIPSRQIAETLGLCGQPQSFDLFEKENGKYASRTFRYGKGWGEMQHFTYLRQDLLERYLAEMDGELIWIIWGERSQVSQNPGAPYKYFHEAKVYRDLQKASGDS